MVITKNLKKKFKNPSCKVKRSVMNQLYRDTWHFIRYFFFLKKAPSLHPRFQIHDCTMVSQSYNTEAIVDFLFWKACPANAIGSGNPLSFLWFELMLPSRTQKSLAFFFFFFKGRCGYQRFKLSLKLPSRKFAMSGLRLFTQQQLFD